MIGPAISSRHGSGTVDVHLILTPRDDEVNHMPVSGTRMHPGGIAFILLLEHGTLDKMAKISPLFDELVQ